MPARIEDYGLISDCESAALLGRDVSIDWLCLPRFDSGACFAALLGNKEHGRWRIHAPDAAESTRSYEGETLVLQTEYVTATGRCRVRDCLLWGRLRPRLSGWSRGCRALSRCRWS